METTMYLNKNMFRREYNIAMSVFAKRDNSAAAHKASRAGVSSKKIAIGQLNSNSILELERELYLENIELELK